jgi:hypothetical protein
MAVMVGRTAVVMRMTVRRAQWMHESEHVKLLKI